jgi:S-DNA-T family DNA segregation ATPase FtsK/SpoIIIE
MQQRAQTVHGFSIAAAVLACLFLWLSLVSFDPADAPNPNHWPHPPQAHNAAGRAGAYVAYRLFEYFGYGAYAAVAGLSAALLVLVWKRQLPSLWQRVLGVCLLIAVTSATAHILTASPPLGWPYERGGVVGWVLASWLTQSLKWVAAPVLGYCFVVGLLFTAEEFVMNFLKVVAYGRHGSQEAEEASETQHDTSEDGPGKLAQLGQVFKRIAGKVASIRALRPVPAGVGAAGAGSTRASSSSRLRKPRRKASKVAEPETDVAVEDEAEDTFEEAVEPDEADDDEAWEEEDAGDGAECDYEYEYDDEVDDEEDEEYEDDGDLVDEDEGYDDAEDEDFEEEPLAPEPQMVVNVHSRPKMASQPAAAPVKPYPAELSEWEFPALTLLEEPEYNFTEQQEDKVREQARELEQSLQEYGIEAKVVEIDTGPVITMFGLQVAPGIKVSRIISLSNDIARALCAPSVRVVAPIPGKNTVGIEVPNVDKEKVRLKELMTIDTERAQRMQLPLFLGKDASGGALIGDLAKMPHMLIAGTTGSGKSVCINSIIMSLLMTQRPDMVKLILVDPKMVEMSMFRDVPHLMCPIVTEMERAEKILEWATVKMDERYALLAEAGVRNIAAYNRLTEEEKLSRFEPTTDEEKARLPLHLPYVVIVIDELADMMMMSAKEVEAHLSRLAQKSRAVGIHIIVATQRPEAKIVTGLIKSNLPCRVAFRVASRMDSRIVLDQNGAELLMGQGDMLYLPPGSSKLLRAQGTFLEDGELRNIITDLKDRGSPEYHPELMQLGKKQLDSEGPRDELFDQAVEIVLQSRRGSVSLLQRRLTIGYARASRLIEEMAAAGIVGEYKGSQAREVLLSSDDWQAMKEEEATKLRDTALSGEDVPDMLYDDDM